MNAVKLDFQLTKPAKSGGGDRYEYGVKGVDDNFMVIYIPQTISRRQGIIKERLTITIDEE